MATTYLSRTPSSAGSQTTWTFSAWVKKSQTASSINQVIAQETGDFSSSGILSQIRFQGDQITIANFTANDYRDGGQTTQKFRDISGWYHIVVNFNSTDATLSNRIKVYVNGEEAAFSFNLGDTAQNALSAFNTTDQAMAIGATIHTGTASGYFDGSMAHVHFIDGTAYDASAFGETDSTTGIWKPKTAPSVTYGTNGFFLKFENSGAFGTDSSGNSNTFTVNGTMTQTIDTPSNVFATLNPLDINPSNTNTFANGNTTITTNGNGARSNLGASIGKYYAEVKYVNNTSFCGIMDLSTAITSTSAFIKLFGNNNGQIFVNGSLTDNNVGAGTAIADNSIIMFAMDLDNNRLYIGKNGLWWTSGSGFVSSSLDSYKSFTNTNSNYWGFVATNGSGTSANSWNFGNGYFGTTAVSSAQNPDDGIGIFEYDVPAGYRALCTKSINAEEYS